MVYLRKCLTLFVLILLSSCDDHAISKGFEVANENDTYIARYYNIGEGGGVGSVHDIINIQNKNSMFDPKQNVVLKLSGARNGICLDWVGNNKLIVSVPSTYFKVVKKSLIIEGDSFDIFISGVGGGLSEEKCSGRYGGLNNYGDEFD